MAVFKDFHPTQLQSTLEDSDAIKSAVSNILNFRLYTLMGNPQFGANLHQYLFEQIDFITMHQIEEAVKHSLYTYEPRITNIEVNVTNQPAYNRVSVQVSFTIKNTNTSEQVTIKLR